MTAKTSYTIPEVAKVCNVSEKLVNHWCDRGSLILSRPSLTVSRDNLLLFMNRVGLSVEGILHDHREIALKDLMYRERALLYNLLLREATLETGTEWGKGYQAILEEMKSLGILEGK